MYTFLTPAASKGQPHTASLWSIFQTALDFTSSVEFFYTGIVDHGLGLRYPVTSYIFFMNMYFQVFEPTLFESLLTLVHTLSLWKPLISDV